MQEPLIGRGWRRPAAVAALVGLAVFLVLAVLLFHGTRTTFDSWVFRVLPGRISPGHNQFLLGFTEPSVSVLLLALTVVLALSVRRYDVAVLAALGPALGTVLASDVAKPIIHRTLFGGAQGSFPSGHQTGVTCTATVLLVAFGQLPLRRAARYALVAVLAAWVVISAVALTRFYYHYATDTIGATGLSIALVLGSAALLDRYWPRRRRRPLPPKAHRPQPGPGRPRPGLIPDARQRSGASHGPGDRHRAQLTPRS